MTPVDPSGTAVRSSRWTSVLACCAFPILAFVLYSGVLHAPFVFDDVQIQACGSCHPDRLSGVAAVFLAPGLPHKLTMASFALNVLLGGQDTFGFHVVNIAIHGLVGVLLYWLGRRLLALLPPGHAWHGAEGPIAFAGALLWLVHPVQAQVVAYVWQRSTSLAALFFLASVLAYLRGRVETGQGRRWWLSCSAVCGVLALLSKENAATLPLVLLALEAALTESAVCRPGSGGSEWRWLWGPSGWWRPGTWAHAS
jgi:protein O-mannosyl-transferase